MGNDKKAVRYTSIGPAIISKEEFREMARENTVESVGQYAKGTDGLAHKVSETIRLRDRSGNVIAETHNDNVSDE